MVASGEALYVKPVAGRPAAHGGHFFYPAAICSALDRDDHIHRFGDEFRVWRHTSFLNELANADQRSAGIIGMHCADTARMPGIPGFEQGQGATVAHFTDHDSVWPQPHGGAQQPGHVGVVAGAQEHDVFSIDLQFARVFDHHDAVFAVKPGHGVEDGVSQGGLARAGAAAHQHVQPASDRLFECLALGVRHDALDDIVIQGKDQRRLLPQCKARTLDQGRNQRLEPAAVQR